MMKIIGVTLLLFGSVTALSLGIDLFQGMKALQALYNALSPFRVMEVAELFVLFSLLFFFFAESLYLVLKKRQQKQ
ncbi:hypothetical protein GOICGAJE_03840 [Bacillus sp. MB95]|nr:hypothetical protein [Bacillus sp. MB95]